MLFGKKGIIRIAVTTLTIVLIAISIGYSLGLIPAETINALETFFNGGTPVEEQGYSLEDNPVTQYIQEIAGIAHDAQDDLFSSQTSPNNNQILSNNIENENFRIEFIDVGQADCTFIICDNEAMLIDAGNIGDGPLVSQYLKEKGIENFKYIIGSHAHEDHIGGLDDIINDFNVDYVVLPNTSPNPNETFKYVESAAKKSSASIISPEKNKEYTLGSATFNILNTTFAADSTNENEYSIVLRITYGDISFMIMGDAESENEKIILEENSDLSTTVLRVGHHGSNTSSSSSFLKAVSPQFSVISVGKNNSYGHPKEKVIERLNKINTEILRTDELGTIIMITDGKQLQIQYANTNTNAG